jgi:hypothetical protein
VYKKNCKESHEGLNRPTTKRLRPAMHLNVPFLRRLLDLIGPRRAAPPPGAPARCSLLKTWDEYSSEAHASKHFRTATATATKAAAGAARSDESKAVGDAQLDFVAQCIRYARLYLEIRQDDFKVHFDACLVMRAERPPSSRDSCRRLPIPFFRRRSTTTCCGARKPTHRCPLCARFT